MDAQLLLLGHLESEPEDGRSFKKNVSIFKKKEKSKVLREKQLPSSSSLLAWASAVRVLNWSQDPKLGMEPGIPVWDTGTSLVSQLLQCILPRTV